MKRFLLCAVFAFSSTSYTQDYKQEAADALKQKDAGLALKLLKKALQENPDDVRALLQMATTLFFTHQYKAAASYYEQAVALNPDHRNIRYNCATAHSKYGNFSRALKLYEQVYRKFADENAKGVLFKMYIRCQKWNKAVEMQAPQLWWYTENIYGKTVLLDCDKQGNGFGDVIQFMRYAQILHQAGARVVVKAPRPLLPLLQRCNYIDQLVGPDDEIPASDMRYDICIASLLLQTKDLLIMNTPQRPYLSADPELVSFWKNRIPNNDSLKVGLCWKSNLVRDRFTEEIVPSPRSISLEELAPLAHQSVSFYSLHKLPNPIEAPFPLIQQQYDFDESHGRFMDTAALIMNMDLIITVDTSIAHLAGALDKKVWLLLSCESDYRWFTKTDTSALYPNMKLFRQKSYRDWNPIIATIQQKLHKQATTHRGI